MDSSRPGRLPLQPAASVTPSPDPRPEDPAMSQNKNAGAGALEVRARETVLPDGSESIHLFVHCPNRGTLSVSECARCADCAGVHVNLMERDWNVECLRQRPERSGEAGTVSALLPHDFWCVRASLGLEAAAQLILREQLAGVVVVDAGDRPVGVLMAEDVLATRIRWLGSTRQEEALVMDALSGSPVTPLSESEPAQAAAMAFRKGGGLLPVVDEGGALVGVLSALGVLAWMERTANEKIRERSPVHSSQAPEPRSAE
jgi:CBS domain-containing protein